MSGQANLHQRYVSWLTCQLIKARLINVYNIYKYLIQHTWQVNRSSMSQMLGYNVLLSLLLVYFSVNILQSSIFLGSYR